MLVLTRKTSERLVIRVGDKEIVVTLVETDRGRCRLGITADRDVVILREELVGTPADTRRQAIAAAHHPAPLAPTGG